MNAPAASEGEPLPPALTRAAEGTGAADGAPLPPFTAAPRAAGPATVAAPAIPASVEAATPVEQAESDASFPLDAFIVPDDARRVPAGFAGGAQEADAETPQEAVELADRLERLAAELRRGGIDAVRTRLASTDRLDALLAAVLTGYDAGHRD